MDIKHSSFSGISMSIDVKEFEKAEKLIREAPKEYMIGMVRAINRSLPTGSKIIQKDIAEEYTIKPMSIRRSIVRNKATTKNPSGEIIVVGIPLRMSNFKFKPTKVPTTRKQQLKGVQIKVKKQGGYLKSKSDPPMFVGTNKSGAPEVFERTKGGKFKIGWAFSLSIPQMLSSPQVYDKVKKEVGEKFEKELTHEVEYRLENSYNTATRSWSKK